MYIQIKCIIRKYLFLLLISSSYVICICSQYLYQLLKYKACFLMYTHSVWMKQQHWSQRSLPCPSMQFSQRVPTFPFLTTTSLTSPQSIPAFIASFLLFPFLVTLCLLFFHCRPLLPPETLVCYPSYSFELLPGDSIRFHGIYHVGESFGISYIGIFNAVVSVRQNAGKKNTWSASSVAGDGLSSQRRTNHLYSHSLYDKTCMLSD